MTPTIAFIPARGGSKGLPGKNTKLLAGKPLYRHSVDQALAAGIEQVFISTDIDEILTAALPDRASAVKRTKALAGDETPMDAVLMDFLQQVYPGQAQIVLLQPTSPMRTPEHIREGLHLYHDSQPSLLMSVCAAPASTLKFGTIDSGRFQAMRDNAHCFANRQSLPDVYRPNGAIYIFDADRFRRTGALSSDNILPLIMDEASSQDIDNLDDFKRCERLLNDKDRST